MYKNVASQKVAVYAHDTAADTPKAGDAANITAQVSKDGGATAASNDANPTELDATDAPGIYLFDLTQAESNCDLFILFAKSSTSDIQLEPVIIYTLPGTNAGVLADTVLWAGDTPNPLINGRVDTIVGAFLIDESRVDGACTEGGETQSFTTNLTETETDYYAGWVFMFTDAGVNQAVPRVVRSYNGGTKEITLITPLPANTTNGHAFALVALTTGAELTDGSMALNMSYTSSAVLDAEQAGFLTPGTIGESINEAATNTGLTAQAVRDAMKLAPSGGAPAGGSLDDMVATVETNTQNIETDTGTDIPALIAALNDLTSAEVGDAVLDEVVEGSLTLRQIMRITLAALANKAAGGGTTTIAFRDLADSKARISATVDVNGNRTAVTLDGS